MWEWMERDRYFLSEPFVVLTVDQFVGHGGSSLERQRQDSHVYRKTGTLPLICRKKQSRLCINEEVRETTKEEWTSWHVMDAKINTANNYMNLLVCGKHKCIERYSIVIKPILISWRFVVNIKTEQFSMQCPTLSYNVISSVPIGYRKLKLATTLPPAFFPRFRQFISVYFDFSLVLLRFHFFSNSQW